MTTKDLTPISAQDMDKALAKNWLNSPFVSQNDDGTESVINEHHLYFIRQIRKPVPMINLGAGAAFFGRIISGPWDSNDETRLKLLFHYEQFFARIELLSQIVRFEVLIRQLVHSHLSKLVNSSDLEDKKLIKEQENVIKGILALVRTLVRRDAEQNPHISFPLKDFETLIDKVYTVYVGPLILLRNAMCHGNIRSYIKSIAKDTSPTVGFTSNHDIDGRAVAIYENIDAVTYYMMSQNIGIIHRLTYAPLVHYKPGNLLTRILEDANYSNKTGYLLPDLTWIVLPKDYLKGITNQQLKDACICPPKLYETFVRACQH
jgi:hypothetical protein